MGVKPSTYTRAFSVHPTDLVFVSQRQGDIYVSRAVEHSTFVAGLGGVADSHDQFDAGDADFVYSMATHGLVFTIFANNQTTTRAWVFNADQGTSGQAFGFLVNYSLTQAVTISVEDATSLGNYISQTLRSRHAALIQKREDGQWFVAFTAPQAAGLLASQDTVSVAASDISGFDQWRIGGRTSSGTGVMQQIDLTALTEKTTIHNNDLLLLVDSEASNAFKKVKKSNLSSAAATPSVVTATPTGGKFSMTTSHRAKPENVILLAAEAVDIEVPKAASPPFHFEVDSGTANTVTISVEDDAGSVNGSAGGSVTLAGSGAHVRGWVQSNAGTAPVVRVEGETTETRTLSGNLALNSKQLTGTGEFTGTITHSGAVSLTNTLTMSSSGNIVGGDKVISAACLKDTSETVNAIGNTSGGVSVDFSAGNVATYTLTGNQTSLTITNPPASGTAGFLTLIITQDGTGSRTTAWGAAFTFPGGTDFVASTAAGAVDIFTFMTINGGTTWRGFEGGKAFAT